MARKNARQPCSVEGCDLLHGAKGMCKVHYNRWRRKIARGDKPRRQPLWDRFWPKVDVGLCWVWTGSRNALGYGSIMWDDRVVRPAHRAAWTMLVGPIPDGMELDHLCRNTACVNPDHLEPVTHAENMRRATWSAPYVKRALTHCPAGHPYSGDNLYLNPKGRRECRTCRAVRRNPGPGYAT